MDRMEERLAELMRQTDEMSDVIARQQQEIDRLTTRVALLMEREASREADSEGSIFLGDERPPHY
ncbi:SlyX protein [Aquicoccus sp. SCR17]|nr:SlyX protein [Carideicomes alvinocaridis]